MWKVKFIQIMVTRNLNFQKKISKNYYGNLKFIGQTTLLTSCSLRMSKIKKVINCSLYLKLNGMT
jgi:hypothetical protein